jgi:hypothetical protein
MAREPAYPKDASVGGKAAPAPETNDTAPTDMPPAPPGEEAAGNPRRKKQIVAGAAIGIGSAAIVAALLYANRNRRSDGR